MSLQSGCAKLTLMAAIVIVMGPPLIHSVQVLALLAISTWVIFGRLGLPSRHALAAGLGAIGLFLAAALALPQIRIQEGHNMFLVDGGKHEAALRQALSDGIYRYASAAFERFYPLAGQCSPERPCWRQSAAITSPFAFAPDGALQHPTMSKVTDFPRFEGLSTFRGGFRNAQGTLGIPSTNWYDWEAGPGDPIRSQMPFFVVYVIPEALAGQEFCTLGDWFYVTAGREPDHDVSRNYTCRKLTLSDAGTTVYGLSVDPGLTLGLKMPITPTWAVIFHVLSLATRLMAAALLAWLFVLPGWSNLAVFWAVTAAPALTGGYQLYRDFENQVFTGGEDPLLHWGYGQRILQEAVAGHWWEAARGVESVFYFMPGYRYFRAFEMTIFGDSGFLSFTALMAYPYLIFALARRLGGAGLAVVSLPLAYVAFALTAAHLQGWAEIVAYPGALIALCLLLSWPSQDAEKRPGAMILIALILAGVCVLRPNLGLCALMALGATITVVPRRDWLRSAVAALVGFAPVGLMLLHNLAFGGRFVLATDAATIKENLAAAPSVYGRAIVGLLSGQTGTPEIVMSGRQLSQWITGEGGQPCIALAILVSVYAILIGWSETRRLIIVECRRPATVIVLAAWMGTELPLLFYVPAGRYAFLAGQLGFLLVFRLVTVMGAQSGLSWPPRWLAKAATKFAEAVRA